MKKILMIIFAMIFFSGCTTDDVIDLSFFKKDGKEKKQECPVCQDQNLTYIKQVCEAEKLLPCPECPECNTTKDCPVVEPCPEPEPCPVCPTYGDYQGIMQDILEDIDTQNIKMNHYVDGELIDTNYAELLYDIHNKPYTKNNIIMPPYKGEPMKHVLVIEFTQIR